MMIHRFILIFLVAVSFCQGVSAHHVLGRPAYSLNEDSNTPPSLAVETQIGKFFITYMVFPAFPKANQPGRLNLYATRIDNGLPFQGELNFSVRDASWRDRWTETSKEKLGTQLIDDGVYRQGFVFSKDGEYVIRAFFEADGEPYEIDFPLQVGQPPRIGTVGVAITLLLFIILSANILQRRRITRAKMQSGVRSRA